MVKSLYISVEKLEQQSVKLMIKKEKRKKKYKLKKKKGKTKPHSKNEKRDRGAKFAKFVIKLTWSCHTNNNSPSKTRTPFLFAVSLFSSIALHFLPSFAAFSLSILSFDSLNLFAYLGQSLALFLDLSSN